MFSMENSLIDARMGGHSDRKVRGVFVISSRGRYGGRRSVQDYGVLSVRTSVNLREFV